MCRWKQLKREKNALADYRNGNECRIWVLHAAFGLLVLSIRSRKMPLKLLIPFMHLSDSVARFSKS